MGQVTCNSNTITIFTIPVELAQRILTFCHPWDVASFSRSCRLAYNLVNLPTDQYLWRQLFMAYPFDDPSALQVARQKANLPCNSLSMDWMNSLKARLSVELIARKFDSASDSERQCVLETFISAVEESAPSPLSPESATFHRSYNLQWVENVLRETRLLDSDVSPDSSVISGLCAQLRSYLALTIDDSRDTHTLARLKERRNKSRGYVYDLRNYTSDNRWGPYTSHEDVNWVHIEHLINIILMNLRELPGMWAMTRPPLGLEATRPYSAPGRRSSDDWAGVEGTWRRYVCFMDYRDLFAFNYSDLADGPRHPKFFQDPRFREATRLIEVKLHIIGAEQSRFYRTTKLYKENLEYPLLCFAGSSRGVNGNQALIEGYVRMGKDGNPHWHFISIYDNSPQWSSSGVHIGNIGSAMGVVGVWTTTIHDQGDPVGPFWLWKVEDDYPTHLMEYT